ncbi:Rha family transcriptional regulator, partial [Proteus mirabilis]|uniref:Rha family transcriptional regulator n=1 Tax=Proteus mirabilis TaxID=584 RepID=UPI00391AD078
VDDLNEFGRVAFEMRSFDTDGGRQKQQVALLNEQQATLLITYMRNNDVVREFKKKLVSEFFKMRSALAAKKIDRNTSRLEYKPMTDAVKKSREEQGKT